MPKVEAFPADRQLENATLLALSALLARTDLRGRPFFWIDFREDPPAAHHAYWDYCDISGRFVDGLVLGRRMTGFAGGEDKECLLREFLWAQQDPGTGLFYNPDPGAWEVSKYLPDSGVTNRNQHVDLFCQRAPLLAMSTLLAAGDESARPRAQRMIRGLLSIAQPADRGLFFPTYRWAPSLSPEWFASSNPPERWLGYRYALLTGLSRYAELTGEEEALRLANGLAQYYIEHGDVSPDGHYSGNTHSGGILPTAVGIARLGKALGDAHMLEWAHQVYVWTRENISDFGFLPDGLGLTGFFASTCETCALADFIHLALLLTEAGIGDYRDDIERVARNQLLENQYRDAGLLRQALPNICDDVLAMLLGAFECAALPNSLLTWIGSEACCIGGGLRALYLVWRACLSEDETVSSINLAFSASSPHVEVLGHEPWQGLLEISVRDTRAVRVRVPAGVWPGECRVSIDGRMVRAEVEGRYLVFRDLQPGQVLRVSYPLREQWRQYSIGGQEYQGLWRGNTLLEIEPPGERYPIYRRRQLLESPAPIPAPTAQQSLAELRKGAALW